MMVYFLIILSNKGANSELFRVFLLGKVSFSELKSDYQHIVNSGYNLLKIVYNTKWNTPFSSLIVFLIYPKSRTPQIINRPKRMIARGYRKNHRNDQYWRFVIHFNIVGLFI